MKNARIISVLLLIFIPVLIFIHLNSGESTVEFSDFWQSLVKFDNENIKHKIIKELRFPRTLTAMLAGSSLAISGMLLQTIFQNPLAGPYILGINSGASLLVALFVLSGVSTAYFEIGIVGAGMIGAFSSSLIMIVLSGTLKNKISLILSGIMFGSFSSALVTILQTSSSPEALKAFTLWTMGSLQNVSFENLFVFGLTFLIGLFLAIISKKYLDVLILGEKSARLLGVHIIKTRIIVLSASAILAGVATAFCGPIAFVGLAIPNLVRIIFRTQNHLTLILGNVFFGASFLLFCDILVMQLNDQIAIPLNAITSIIGAPFILLILLKKIR